MTTYIVIAALALLSAIFCAVIAKRLDKDPWTWFLIGLFANLFAFVIIFMSKNIKATNANGPRGE